jgi:hypothetical protein
MEMKKHIEKLLENDLFLLLMSSVFGYTAFAAVIITTIGIPPESILDSGLQEILLVFEG